MSGRAMTEFARALNADGALLKGLIAALGCKEGSEAIEAFVAYARKHGFRVSRDEVAALRRAAYSEDGTPAEGNKNPEAALGPVGYQHTRLRWSQNRP